MISPGSASRIGNEDRLHRLIECQQKTCHAIVGNRDGLLVCDLIDEGGDDRTTAGDDVAVTNAGIGCFAAVEVSSNEKLFLKRLAYAHCICGFCRLVRAHKHTFFHIGPSSIA